jgi:hypothetical protein
MLTIRLRFHFSKRGGFMQLSRWKCLALVFAIPLACHEEVSAPAPVVPGGLYFLSLVGGQLPPVTLHASPGDTATLLFSILTLTPPATASVTDQIRVVQTGSAPTFVDQNHSYSYRIIGDSIAFDYSPPCGPAELCIVPPGARILGDRLLVTFGNPAYRPPFLYAHPGLD